MLAAEAPYICNLHIVALGRRVLKLHKTMCSNLRGVGRVTVATCCVLISKIYARVFFYFGHHKGIYHMSNTDLESKIEESLEMERLEDRFEMAQICNCIICRCNG